MCVLVGRTGGGTIRKLQRQMGVMVSVGILSASPVRMFIHLVVSHLLDLTDSRAAPDL